MRALYGEPILDVKHRKRVNAAGLIQWRWFGLALTCSPSPGRDHPADSRHRLLSVSETHRFRRREDDGVSLALNPSYGAGVELCSGRSANSQPSVPSGYHATLP